MVFMLKNGRRTWRRHGLNVADDPLQMVPLGGLI
jgi:hypothetical protein